MAFIQEFEKTANLVSKLIKGITGKGIATSASKPIRMPLAKAKSNVTDSMVTVRPYSNIGKMPNNMNAAGNLNKGMMNLDPKKSIMDY